MTSVGIKAKIKQELKDQGVKEIRLANGHYVRLANAKTTDLIALQKQLQRATEDR